MFSRLKGIEVARLPNLQHGQRAHAGLHFSPVSRVQGTLVLIEGVQRVHASLNKGGNKVNSAHLFASSLQEPRDSGHERLRFGSLPLGQLVLLGVLLLDNDTSL